MTTLTQPISPQEGTVVERVSERELVASRTFGHSAQALFEAWTRPELFEQWWVPKSCGLTLLSCEMDARTGGGYKLVFPIGETETMAFFGSYLEVVPGAKVVWTNDEGGESGAVTTVTLHQAGGETRLEMRDVHPTAAALDEAIESGSTAAIGETFAQLDALLAGATV